MKNLHEEFVFNQLEEVDIGDRSEEYAAAAENVQDLFVDLVQELPEEQRKKLQELQDDVYLMLAESENARFKQGFVKAFQLLASVKKIKNDRYKEISNQFKRC